MTGRLVALDELLATLVTGLGPVPPLRLPPARAVGLAPAEPLHALSALPLSAVALRAGLAVRALDLVGASPHAPVALASRPTRVALGETLPPDCDAVIDPDVLDEQGPVCEVTEAVEPGVGVRHAGHDMPAGALIATAGQPLGAETAFALTLAGWSEIPVRRPLVGLDFPEGPERDWLELRLAALGLSAGAAGARADLRLRRATDERAHLALLPGETTQARLVGGMAEVDLPARFDGMIAAWCAVVLPLLAKLSGCALATGRRPVSRKLVSPVGMTSFVLLRMDGEIAHPLAVGDVTLAALAAADAFALLPPGAEGVPAGAALALTWLDQPFALPGAGA